MYEFDSDVHVFSQKKKKKKCWVSAPHVPGAVLVTRDRRETRVLKVLPRGVSGPEGVAGHAGSDLREGGLGPRSVEMLTGQRDS